MKYEDLIATSVISHVPLPHPLTSFFPLEKAPSWILCVAFYLFFIAVLCTCNQFCMFLDFILWDLITCLPP